MTRYCVYLTNAVRIVQMIKKSKHHLFRTCDTLMENNGKQINKGWYYDRLVECD